MTGGKKSLVFMVQSVTVVLDGLANHMVMTTLSIFINILI